MQILLHIQGPTVSHDLTVPGAPLLAEVILAIYNTIQLIVYAKASNACPLLQRALQVEDAVAHSRRGLYNMLLFSTKPGIEPETSHYFLCKSIH